MLRNETLDMMYELNFKLMHHYKYSLSELDNMLPFEREVYIALLGTYLKQLQEGNKNA